MIKDASMCTKVSYASRSDAKRNANKTGGGMSIYKCSKCHQFHFTSMTKKELRAFRKRTNEMREMPKEERQVEYVNIRNDANKRHNSIVKKRVNGYNAKYSGVM